MAFLYFAAYWASQSPAAAVEPATLCGWRAIPVPRLSGPNLAGVSGVSPSDTWAVGYYFDSRPPLTLHWNGSKWASIPQAAQGSLADVVAIAANDVWAVGAGPTLPTFTAEHWDGSKWELSAVPDPGSGGGYLNGVDAESSSDVWAVGNYVDQGLHPLTEHWDGANWSWVPAPDGSPFGTNVLHDVSVVSSTDVWAVGYQDVTGGADFQPLIEHWDGDAWSVAQAPTIPGDNNLLYDVYAVGVGDVWAVGSTSGPRPLTMHWDGIKWKLVGVPFPPSTIRNVLSGVSASGPTDVWVVGVSVEAGGTYNPLSIHWDGSLWQMVLVPDPGDVASLQSVDVLSHGGVWTVGAFFSNSEGTRPLTEHLVCTNA
jgi:hypothetical protein